MEDILASIRRILNEDEPGPQAEGAAARPAAAAEPEPEALILTEDMLVEPPRGPAPVVASPEPVAPVEAEHPPVAAAAEPPAAAVAVAATGTDALLAPAAAAAAAASVSGLLRAVAQERGSSVYRGGPTIEDVVREEVRGLLKEWLDANLPPLVERLVRAEIERVVGRAVSGG